MSEAFPPEVLAEACSSSGRRAGPRNARPGRDGLRPRRQDPAAPARALRGRREPAPGPVVSPGAPDARPRRPWRAGARAGRAGERAQRRAAHVRGRAGGAVARAAGGRRAAAGGPSASAAGCDSLSPSRRSCSSATAGPSATGAAGERGAQRPDLTAHRHRRRLADPRRGRASLKAGSIGDQLGGWREPVPTPCLRISSSSRSLAPACPLRRWPSIAFAPYGASGDPVGGREYALRLGSDPPAGTPRRTSAPRRRHPR